MPFSPIIFLSIIALTNHVEVDKNKSVIIFISSDSTTGNPSGIVGKNTSRLFKYLEDETHVHFKLSPVPWNRALISARNGKGFLFGVSKNPDRNSYLKFSEPIYSDTVWLVKRCDSKLKFEQLNDLKHKSIGVIRGASYGDEFDRASGTLFKAEVDVNNSQSRFAKLLKNRTDALVIYSQVQNTTLLENDLNQRYGFLATSEVGSMKSHPYCVLPKSVSTSAVYFAVVPGYDDAYLDRLNAALIKAQVSGKLANIYSGILQK